MGYFKEINKICLVQLGRCYVEYIYEVFTPEMGAEVGKAFISCVSVLSTEPLEKSSALQITANQALLCIFFNCVCTECGET